MTWLQSIITAIVEGLTEFLPISSTAHIKYAQAIMGMNAKEPFTNLFDVVIQLAAILAVVVLYFKKFFNFKNISFYLKLIIAVIPVLILGVLLKKHIDQMLGNITAIAIITLLGGVLLLFVDKWFDGRGTIKSEEAIQPLTAFKVGAFQSLSIIFPGFSRSAATIIGGMASGLTRSTATEFSFFLAVPTMFAATVKDLYDCYKDTPEVFHSSNMSILGIGCIISFLVSIFAIRYFINYIQKHGFKVFGIYRIIAGIIILFLIYTHVIAS